MVVDCSVLVAILTEEPGWAAYAHTLKTSAVSRLGAPSLLEASIILRHKKGEAGVRSLRNLLQSFNILVEPFTEQDAVTATRAHRRYGKGMGHPAQLNILDTCAYALAERFNEPLLFKGTDFSRTDLVVATVCPDK